jgi:hypothetical protein
MPSTDRAADEIFKNEKPYRTPAKVVPQPSKIIQICAFWNNELCALDDNGVVWCSSAKGKPWELYIKP